MGDSLDEAIVAEWTAEVRRLRGDEAGAADILDEVLAIVVPSGSRMLEAAFRIDSSVLDVSRGRLDCARRHLDRVRTIMAGEDWRGLAGRLHAAEASAAAAEGNLEAAASGFEAALAVFRPCALPWEEAETWLRWGQALSSRGHLSEAAHRFEAAQAVYERINAAPRWRDRVRRERSSTG